MSPQTSPAALTAQASAAQGLRLMVRHWNLIHAVASGEMDVEEVIAWTRSLTEEDWRLMVQAEEDAARYMAQGERQALMMAYDDAPMAGRAR